MQAMRSFLSIVCCLLALFRYSSAFVATRGVPPSTISAIQQRRRLQSQYTTSPFVSSSSSRLQMMDPSLVALDATLLLSETEAWVQPTAIFLEVFTNFLSLAMLIRVVLSWYPTMNVKEFPWILVVVPTEPLLKAVRNSIPPAFGVDITPIVWLGFFTFVHEILLGQQGLLTMKIKYGI
jgi:YggT family protein